MSTSNNQDLLLMDDTSSLEDEPVALEFIDYGSITDPSANLNSECDIALEQQPDDLLNTKTGLNISGLFYPDGDPTNIDGTFKRVVFHQVRTMFYNNYRDPTKIWGSDNIDFDLSKTKRKISDEFKLYDIPVNIYGDTIIPNTVAFHDTSLDDFFLITDDGNGNLFAGQNLFSHRQEIGNHINLFANGNNSTCDNYFNVPNAPTNLTASSGSAILNWTDNSNNEDGFVLEKSLDSGSNWSIIQYLGSNVTGSVDSNVSVNNTYWYRVYAFNSIGNSDFSNTASINFSSGSGGSGPDPLAWWKMEEPTNTDRIDAVNGNHLQDFSGFPAPGISRAAGKIGFATQLSTTGFGSADIGSPTSIGFPDLTSGFHVVSWVAFDSWDSNSWYYISNYEIDGIDQGIIKLTALWDASINQIVVVQDINNQNPSDFSASFTPVAGQFYFFNVFWDASDSKYGIQINNGAIIKSPVAIPITGTPTDTFVDILLVWNTNIGNPSTAVVRTDEYGVYGKKLNTNQTDFLYNSGNGQTWPFTLPA